MRHRNAFDCPQPSLANRAKSRDNSIKTNVCKDDILTKQWVVTIQLRITNHKSMYRFDCTPCLRPAFISVEAIVRPSGGRMKLKIPLQNDENYTRTRLIYSKWRELVASNLSQLIRRWSGRVRTIVVEILLVRGIIARMESIPTSVVKLKCSCSFVTIYRRPMRYVRHANFNRGFDNVKVCPQSWKL